MPAARCPMVPVRGRSYGCPSSPLPSPAGLGDRPASPRNMQIIKPGRRFHAIMLPGHTAGRTLFSRVRGAGPGNDRHRWRLLPNVLPLCGCRLSRLRRSARQRCRQTRRTRLHMSMFSATAPIPRPVRPNAVSEQELRSIVREFWRVDTAGWRAHRSTDRGRCGGGGIPSEWAAQYAQAVRMATSPAFVS